MFISKDDYRFHITKNGLFIEPNYTDLKASAKELQKFNGKFVSIAGVFNKDEHGPWGLYSGCIENVTQIALYEREMEMPAMK